jgi:hypothetical protein
MRHTISQHKRAVRCSECGPTVGESACIDQGGLRCRSCGKFAEPCPTFCAKHEVNWGRLSGYDHCPRCRQEESVRAQEREMHQRRADPNMHPTVDAARR